MMKLMQIFTKGRVKTLLLLFFILSITLEVLILLYFSKAYETLFEQLKNNGLVLYNRNYYGSFGINNSALNNNQSGKSLLEDYINLFRNVEVFNRKVSASIIFFAILNLFQSILLAAASFLYEIIQEKNKKDYQKQLTYRDNVIHHYAHLSSLAGISSDIIHQWKQPLNNLMMIISNIQDSVAEKDYEILDDLSVDAKKAITLLSSTINDFKEMLISESDDSLFDIKDVVDNVTLLFKSTLTENGIRCKTEYDGNLRIHGKKSRLMQVFNNLFDNSIYAIKDRKIQNGLITIGCHESNREVIVLFEDNGGGISKDMQENVFNAYYTSKGSQGSGLGLSISNEVLSKYFNGNMEFRNTGTGVEFKLIIPKFFGEN
jgi:signal transduction histidine kinase